MGLQIGFSPASLFAQRETTQTVGRLNNNLEQLASALRINRAADDAAGLAIAERFRSQVRQLEQESNALQSGINAANTAEGALQGQSEAVSRLRELAVQASNGTLTDDQRQVLNEEAQQLVQEIDQTAQRTEFNGLQLLDGSNPNVSLDAEGENVLELPESTVDALGLNGLDLSTQAGAENAIAALDSAAEQISSNRASLGAQTNAFETAIDGLSAESTGLQEAESRIRDLDVAQASIERARNSLLLQANAAGLIQGNLVNQNAARLLGA